MEFGRGAVGAGAGGFGAGGGWRGCIGYVEQVAGGADGGVIVSSVGHRLPQAKCGIGAFVIVIATAWGVKVGELIGTVNADAGGQVAVLVIATVAPIIPPSLASEAFPLQDIVNGIHAVEVDWDACMCP